MAKTTAALLPATAELLRQLGDRLRLARLRRRLSAKQVAERAGMAPMTLRSLERGGSGVTMGAYLAVMQVLGIETDLDLIAKADPVGRELQDAQLPSHSRATRSDMPMPAKRSATSKAPTPKTRMRKPLATTPSMQKREAVDELNAPDTPSKKPLKPSVAARDWIKKSGFTSADALAGLIAPAVRPRKAR